MKRLLMMGLVLSVTSAMADDQLVAGEKIFHQYCDGACHQAPVPERLSSKQWKVVLKTMQKRMRSKGIEPLSEEQTQQVYRYLTQNR